MCNVQTHFSDRLFPRQAPSRSIRMFTKKNRAQNIEIWPIGRHFADTKNVDIFLKNLIFWPFSIIFFDFGVSDIICLHKMFGI